MPILLRARMLRCEIVPFLTHRHFTCGGILLKSDLKFPALNLRFPLLFGMAVARAQNCTIRVEVNRVTRMTNHSSSAEWGL